MRLEKKQQGKRVRLRTQREVLRDVMLSANECGAWLTLGELATMTRYPAASISAQLRHLKKPQFGNFALAKRMREAADTFSARAHGVVWEYRLTRKRRESLQRSRFTKSEADSLGRDSSGVIAASKQDRPRKDIHLGGI